MGGCEPAAPFCYVSYVGAGRGLLAEPGTRWQFLLFGPATRCWRIVYVDVDAMTNLAASENGRAEDH